MSGAIRPSRTGRFPRLEEQRARVLRISQGELCKRAARVLGRRNLAPDLYWKFLNWYSDPPLTVVLALHAAAGLDFVELPCSEAAVRGAESRLEFWRKYRRSRHGEPKARGRAEEVQHG